MRISSRARRIVLLGLLALQNLPLIALPTPNVHAHFSRFQPAAAGINTAVYCGFGFEARGVAGQAETLYAGAATETKRILLRTAFSCDARSVRLGTEKYFDFRSWMLEAGTGRSASRPFSLRFRYQIERFSGANASLQSVIPFITFDARWFFCALGYNFRTLSLYDGGSRSPWFTIEERELACAAGIRIPLSERLWGSLALRNYDDYCAGNVAALGWEGSLDLRVSRYEIRASAIWKPSGATALAATPSGAVFRVCAGMTL